MGSTSYLAKPKSAGYRAKSGSSVGSDREMNGKLKRNKIRRPTKMNEYGLKRVPDYTELAYKEACSKLRYFLSGNYAPSVRSYGGSASIKNLDESDGDGDKKYSPYSPALAEYRPRPRLAAKYATLYADSLNNYTPQLNTSATVPPAAASPVDATGGTNPDVVNFIQKQEEYIEQLERESQYCRDELNNLLGKVKEVISENEHLHEAQKTKLITRMFHSCAGSETDDLDDVGDSTGLDSDNKISPSKARKPVKTRSTRLEGPNIVFESRIAELEAQLTQAKIDLKKVQDENNENKRKLASGLVDSTCLDGFKRQIDNLQRDKSALESQISKLKLSLENRDDGYKRSDGMETQLREERNNLEAELRRLKDDLAKERSKVRELAGEGARRAIQERSAAEQRYNAHFDELQHDLAAQYDNVAKLQLQLERNRRDENELKRELSIKNNVIEELRTELKNKTSSLQAELSQARAERASLDEELAAARLAIERHQRQAQHEANRLNSEIQSLRQRLDRADADLVHSRRENLRLSEQIATLEKELNMKHLTPITPEKTKKEKELSTMLDSIENKHAKTVAELESMIQSQNSLMEKLTGECRLLTDKLDDANRRHKQELATLQRQVDTLGRSFQNSPRTAPSSYQARTPHAPATIRDVPTTPGAGHVDPGIESTGNSPGLGTLPPDQIRPDQPIRDERGDRQTTRQLTKQDSRQSLHSQPQDATKIQHVEQLVDQPVEYNEDAVVESIVESEKDAEIEEDEVMEVEQPETEFPEQNFENYEQTPVTETGYQNQEYEQNFEQPTYAEGQYENYEQYPQQYTEPTAQYEDPNAQYQGDPNTQYEADPNTQYEADPNTQYEADPNTQYQTDPNTQYQADPNTQYQADPNTQYDNTYAPESNYQADPNYDTTQYTEEYQGTPQYQGMSEVTESKDTLPRQS